MHQDGKGKDALFTEGWTRLELNYEAYDIYLHKLEWLEMVWLVGTGATASVLHVQQLPEMFLL